MSVVDLITLVEYRDILGWEGYRAGSNGTIWTRRMRRWDRLADSWRELKPSPVSSGYLRVSLCRNDGKPRDRFVHRLLLETFVGPCPPGMQCRHLDGDKTNNRLDNLCWGTAKDNKADQIRHGTINRGLRHGRASASAEQVREVRRLFHDGASRAAIARMLGLTPRVVECIARSETYKNV